MLSHPSHAHSDCQTHPGFIAEESTAWELISQFSPLHTTQPQPEPRPQILEEEHRRREGGGLAMLLQLPSNDH